MPSTSAKAMQRFDKYTLQTLGFALIVLGIFLFMLGLIGGPIRIHFLTGEPLPWYWWVPTASCFSGIALVIYRNLFAYCRSKHDTRAGREWPVKI